MASGIYTNFKKLLATKGVDFSSDTVNVALYGIGHVFNASDTTYTTENELPTAGGYVRGGIALENMVVSTGTIETTMNLDADNPYWTNATFTFYHAVFYDITAGNALICSIDYDMQKITNGTVTLVIDSSGIISLV
jgi:hypothetical protein